MGRQTVLDVLKEAAWFPFVDESLMADEHLR
jgi:hypothetical protein